MSIFLTRPVINTEEERNAKADILELIPIPTPAKPI